MSLSFLCGLHTGPCHLTVNVSPAIRSSHSLGTWGRHVPPSCIATHTFRPKLRPCVQHHNIAILHRVPPKTKFCWRQYCCWSRHIFEATGHTHTHTHTHTHIIYTKSSFQYLHKLIIYSPCCAQNVRPHRAQLIWLLHASGQWMTRWRVVQCCSKHVSDTVPTGIFAC